MAKNTPCVFFPDSYLPSPSSASPLSLTPSWFFHAKRGYMTEKVVINRGWGVKFASSTSPPPIFNDAFALSTTRGGGTRGTSAGKSYLWEIMSSISGQYYTITKRIRIEFWCTLRIKDGWIFLLKTQTKVKCLQKFSSAIL